jgi:rRNA maturation protein Rpf1
LILLTTSRRPTGRIRSFCRDLVNSIPNIKRVNRGKMSLNGLAEKAIELETNKILLLERWHGGPGKINLFDVLSDGLDPVSPLMLISNIRLRREFEEETRRVKSSIITFELEDSSKLQQIAENLSTFFDLPILPFDKAIRRHRASMHLSFNSQRKIQIMFMLIDRMIEIGPRVTLSKLIWNLKS